MLYYRAVLRLEVFKDLSVIVYLIIPTRQSFYNVSRLKNH